MLDLPAAYRSVTSRPWPHDRLAGHDLAARQRGNGDLPVGRVAPADHPIVFVADAMPRLTSLTVAAHLLHVLPPSEPSRETADELLQVVDAASAGSLHRVHLALAAVDQQQADDADGWEPVIYDESSGLLHGRSTSTTHRPRKRSLTASRACSRSVSWSMLSSTAPSPPAKPQTRWQHAPPANPRSAGIRTDPAVFRVPGPSFLGAC